MAVPFEGCVIALSGKFEEAHGNPFPLESLLACCTELERIWRVVLLRFANNRAAKIASLIKSNGGKHSTKIDGGVTHLVATVNEGEKENAKGKFVDFLRLSTDIKLSNPLHFSSSPPLMAAGQPQYDHLGFLPSI